MDTPALTSLTVLNLHGLLPAAMAGTSWLFVASVVWLAVGWGGWKQRNTGSPNGLGVTLWLLWGLLHVVAPASQSLDGTLRADAAWSTLLAFASAGLVVGSLGYAAGANVRLRPFSGSQSLIGWPSPRYYAWLVGALLFLVWGETVYSYLVARQHYGAEASFYRLLHLNSGIKSLADSLILLLILAPKAGLSWRKTILLFLPLLVLALVEGIRYRPVLVVLGWVVFYAPGWWQATDQKQRVRASILVLSVILIVQLWSANRWAIARQEWTYLTLNPAANGASPTLEYQMLHTGATVLTFQADNHIGPDYGRWWAEYSLVRFMPRWLLNQVQPLPTEGRGLQPSMKPLSPQLSLVTMATVGTKYKDGVPAYGCWQEWFLSFGWWGLWIPLAIGFLLGQLASWKGDGLLNVGLQILALIVGYQWFTRGYLPQQLELTWFCLLGIIMLAGLNRITIITNSK